MITQALRNITACLRHEKEQKGGSAKLRQESTAGLLGSAFQVSLYYNLLLLQKKMSFFSFLYSNRNVQWVERNRALVKKKKKNWVEWGTYKENNITYAFYSVYQ